MSGLDPNKNYPKTWHKTQESMVRFPKTAIISSENIHTGH